MAHYKLHANDPIVYIAPTHKSNCCCFCRCDVCDGSVSTLVVCGIIVVNVVNKKVNMGDWFPFLGVIRVKIGTSGD